MTHQPTTPSPPVQAGPISAHASDDGHAGGVPQRGDDYEFELTITRRKPNPEFEEPKPGGYYHSNNPNPRFIEERSLSVVLTREEFDAIRFACLRGTFTVQP